MHPVNTSINNAQVENSAGGFVYSLTDLERLKRFLILGSDANSFYASAKVNLLRSSESSATRTPALFPIRVSYSRNVWFSRRT